MSKKKMTLKEVKARIQGLDEETQKDMVCALIGHSRIQTTCFGYYYCARCGAQVGDTLGSTYQGAEDAVVVGHNCDVCRTNYEKCDWRDKFMAPHPFTDKEE